MAMIGLLGAFVSIVAGLAHGLGTRFITVSTGARGGKDERARGRHLALDLNDDDDPDDGVELDTAEDGLMRSRAGKAAGDTRGARVSPGADGPKRSKEPTFKKHRQNRPCCEEERGLVTDHVTDRSSVAGSEMAASMVASSDMDLD